MNRPESISEHNTDNDSDSDSDSDTLPPSPSSILQTRPHPLSTSRSSVSQTHSQPLSLPTHSHPHSLSTHSHPLSPKPTATATATAPEPAPILSTPTPPILSTPTPGLSASKPTRHSALTLTLAERRDEHGLVTAPASAPLPEQVSPPHTSSRKRGPPTDWPTSPRTPTSDSLFKRARLFPHPRRSLDPSSPLPLPLPTTSIDDREYPLSPLFFSNSPRLRPNLPPRFSSAEAAAKMLSKANGEDSHVRTVTLARGTVSTPTIPTIPTSAPIHYSLDRSTATRSESPDAMHGDVTLDSLAAIGILELLDQDDRPTCIIDLADSHNYGQGPLHPLFVNFSLRSYPALLDTLTSPISDDTSSPNSFLHFKAWILSAVVNGEALNVCLPPFNFAGISWQVSTLRKRLRVLSGHPQLNITHPKRSTSSSMRNIKSANPSVTPSHSVRSEHMADPQDYFGEATMAADRPSTATSSVPSPSEALPTVEVAESRKPILQQITHRRDGSPLIERIVPLARFQENPTSPSSYENVLAAHTAGNVDLVLSSPAGYTEGPSYDWTRLPVTSAMPEHVRFARSVDWSATALGPIENWSADLRQMCNLIMASPHPAAMYWGDDLSAIYNEAYVLLAGQKHPKLMGQSYKEAWAEIWPEVEGVFANAINTGEATMKDDDRLFILRNNYLEETYFSWSIIPLVGGDGRVRGMFNPAFEKTRRKLAERRMLTLREIGERTASARDVKAFWGQVLGSLETNEYDTPFVLLYSVSDESDSDSASVSSSSGSKQCTLEGSLGVPDGHRAAPATIDLKTGEEGFGPVFREVMKTIKPVLLEVGSQDLPSDLVEGLHTRGFDDPCRGVVVCPIHPTTGESILGFLVIGVNPRRPYDEDYALFIQLLSRQLATSLASVVLFEGEIRRGQRAAQLAALDRMELSEQLAARTQEAIESETKFTRMAELAPVGMFIANPEGKITYCNKTWFDISHVSASRDEHKPDDQWMDAVKDDDRPLVIALWRDLIERKEPQTGSFRFKAPWQDNHGIAGERWVLFSAYPEKYDDGALKSVFGSLTDISKQKWAEDFQKRRMEEAVELKKSLERFVDMTSHEMRNPLSAILQLADDVTNTMSQLQTKEVPTDEAIISTIDSAQTIMLCAQHQKRIVDDILTLSKLDGQLLLVTPVDAQPVTVAERALKMHEGELQTADIQLKFVVDESYKALDVDWVRFDPSRVLQVLINLTTNAIKFTTMETKRTIIVTVGASKESPSAADKRLVNYFPSRRKPDEGYGNAEWGSGEEIFIQFSVQDTGRGLDDEEKKMLFMRFSQASPRTHVQYGGSGLGLFISRELTELQGGEIGVASEAGVGSTFAFYIKARRSTAPPDDKVKFAGGHVGVVKGKSMLSGIASAATSAAPTNTAGPDASLSEKPMRVLIVEDNLVNQRVMSKQLKNLGCVVHTANHGGEALEMLAKSTYWNHDPDSDVKPADRIELTVVLMDQEMPVMDGLTCTKRIRELEKAGKFIKHVPIIAVTANARSEQIETAIGAGMDAVQPKPFRIPELMERMRELRAKMEID